MNQTYFKLCAEPETDDSIFVDLTPDIQNTQNHCIH